MIDLDLLRAFLATFRQESVTKAANTLALSQSALSGRLQALEAKLGKVLFVRDGRGIRPTPHARALARAIASHIDGLETIFAAHRAQGSAISGPIKIAGPAEFIERFIIPSFGVLIDLGVRPEFIPGPADRRLKGLVAGDIDLAILTTRARNPGVTTSRLHREHFILVAAPRWAEALRQNAEQATRCGEVPILAYSDSLPIIRRYWSEVFGHEPAFAAALVLPDLRTLVAATVAGIGATVVPDYLCWTEIEGGRLVRYDPPLPGPTNDIELAWRSGGRQHPRNLMVRDLLLRKLLAG